jgi:hypothetical protein
VGSEAIADGRLRWDIGGGLGLYIPGRSSATPSNGGGLAAIRPLFMPVLMPELPGKGPIYYLSPPYSSPGLETLDIEESSSSKVIGNAFTPTAGDYRDTSFFPGLLQQKAAGSLVNGKQAVAAEDNLIASLDRFSRLRPEEVPELFKFVPATSPRV